jgi:hypothetical protein
MSEGIKIRDVEDSNLLQTLTHKKVTKYFECSRNTAHKIIHSVQEHFEIKRGVKITLGDLLRYKGLIKS